MLHDEWRPELLKSTPPLAEKTDPQRSVRFLTRKQRPVSNPDSGTLRKDCAKLAKLGEAEVGGVVDGKGKLRDAVEGRGRTAALAGCC